MSVCNDLLKKAVDSGEIDVIRGVVYGKRGKRKTYMTMTGGYAKETFTIHYEKRRSTVQVSRLVAYKKYGNAMFAEGIVVRHLDGDSTNNLPENIAIGSQSQNMMDRPEEERIKSAKTASSYLRKFTDAEENEIVDYHNFTGSYSMTMRKFEISSKGTLWYILNKSK